MDQRYLSGLCFRRAPGFWKDPYMTERWPAAASVTMSKYRLGSTVLGEYYKSDEYSKEVDCRQRRAGLNGRWLLQIIF